MSKTKEKALYEFFSGFGMEAYPSQQVLDDVTFPFLVYNVPTAAFDEGEVSGTVYLRYYTEKETEPNAKARQIAETIGRGGKLLLCDEGAIWIKRGTPFKVNAPQEQGTEETKYLKTKQLNITVEYLTVD